MLLIEFLLISLIILTILTQNLSIRIFDNDGWKLRLSLTLFALDISIDNSGEKEAEKKASIINKIEYYSSLFGVIKQAIYNSSVTVYKFEPYEEVAENVPRLIGTAIGAPIFIVYLSAMSHSFEVAGENALGNKIDISFDIPLFLVIISLIKFQYYKVKFGFNRGRKNVG